MPHIDLIRTAGTYLAALASLAWERAVALAPGLRDAWEAVAARVPFRLRGGSDTFFPVRSQRDW